MYNVCMYTHVMLINITIFKIGIYFVRSAIVLVQRL